MKNVWHFTIRCKDHFILLILLTLSVGCSEHKSQLPQTRGESTWNPPRLWVARASESGRFALRGLEENEIFVSDRFVIEDPHRTLPSDLSRSEMDSVGSPGYSITYHSSCRSNQIEYPKSGTTDRGLILSTQVFSPEILSDVVVGATSDVICSARFEVLNSSLNAKKTFFFENFLLKGNSVDDKISVRGLTYSVSPQGEPAYTISPEKYSSIKLDLQRPSRVTLGCQNFRFHKDLDANGSFNFVDFAEAAISINSSGEPDPRIRFPKQLCRLSLLSNQSDEVLFSKPFWLEFKDPRQISLSGRLLYSGYSIPSPSELPIYKIDFTNGTDQPMVIGLKKDVTQSLYFDLVAQIDSRRLGIVNGSPRTLIWQWPAEISHLSQTDKDVLVIPAGQSVPLTLVIRNRETCFPHVVVGLGGGVQGSVVGFDFDISGYFESQIQISSETRLEHLTPRSWSRFEKFEISGYRNVSAQRRKWFAPQNQNQPDGINLATEITRTSPFTPCTE